MKVITQFKNTRKFKIISTKIAGIVLSGDEIKSIRDRKISINEAFILPHNQELYLRDVYIASYQYANLFGKQHQDKRKRKLLLNKREIDYLISQMRSKHYNLIPLQVFVNERGWAKIQIALVQNLRKFQRKAEIKDKEIKKRLQRREYD